MNEAVTCNDVPVADIVEYLTQRLMGSRAHPLTKRLSGLQSWEVAELIGSRLRETEQSEDAAPDIPVPIYIGDEYPENPTEPCLAVRITGYYLGSAGYDARALHKAAEQRLRVALRQPQQADGPVLTREQVAQFGRLFYARNGAGDGNPIVDEDVMEIADCLSQAGVSVSGL